MPEVRDVGDGSQDALLVRVQAGGFTGWGECEAAPLVSMASLELSHVHSACKPLSASVLGQKLDGVEDIRRINALVRANSFDLPRRSHTRYRFRKACGRLGANRNYSPAPKR